jgi:hypothetical protein
LLRGSIDRWSGSSGRVVSFMGQNYPIEKRRAQRFSSFRHAIRVRTASVVSASGDSIVVILPRSEILLPADGVLQVPARRPAAVHTNTARYNQFALAR